MSPKTAAVTPCEIYDQALKYARDDQVPPGVPQPGYTSTWLPENIAVLERYVAWLNGGGTSCAGHPHLPHPGGRACLEPQP